MDAIQRRNRNLIAGGASGTVGTIDPGTVYGSAARKTLGTQRVSVRAGQDVAPTTAPGAIIRPSLGQVSYAPPAGAVPTGAVPAAVDPEAEKNKLWNAGPKSVNPGGSLITRSAPSLGAYMQANRGRGLLDAMRLAGASRSASRAAASGGAYTPEGDFAQPYTAGQGLLDANLLAAQGSALRGATMDDAMTTAARTGNIGALQGIIQRARSPFAGRY